jgi:hypothetical protein
MRAIRAPQATTWAFGAILTAGVVFAAIAFEGPATFRWLCVVEPLLLILLSAVVACCIHSRVRLVIILFAIYIALDIAATSLGVLLDSESTPLMMLIAPFVPFWTLILTIGSWVNYRPEAIPTFHFVEGALGAAIYSIIGVVFAWTCSTSTAQNVISGPHLVGSLASTPFVSR